MSKRVVCCIEQDQGTVVHIFSLSVHATVTVDRKTDPKAIRK